MTIAGDFSPGFDGVPHSAQCFFRGTGTSAVKRIDATAVNCDSLALEGAENATSEALSSEIGVALNGAYVDDDSSDYVGVRDTCADSDAFGGYQRFLQYVQRVDGISPIGGPVGGGTAVTIRGAGFAPIETPLLAPALLRPAVRCLWRCTPRDDAPRVCVERGVGAAQLLTVPRFVSNDTVICETPPMADARHEELALAMNVFEGVAASCTDGLRNGAETGIDCGGGGCAPCVPTCHDGLHNGDEEGIDCGGPCAFCVRECDAPTSVDQQCQMPSLSRVTPASGPSGHATLLTIYGDGFRAANEVFTYTRPVRGVETLFTHTSLPRCFFLPSGTELSATAAVVATPASVDGPTRLRCRAPAQPLEGCYTLLVSLDGCDLHESVLDDGCAAERKRGLSWSSLPLALYPGDPYVGASAYAYTGDYVASGHTFRFYREPPPSFEALASDPRDESRPPYDLSAALPSNVTVSAGGARDGGTRVSIHFVRSAASDSPSNPSAPLLALEPNASRALAIMRCAFGAPPYTSPLALTGEGVVCIAPPKPVAMVVALRLALNGEQFFHTGLTFQASLTRPFPPHTRHTPLFAHARHTSCFPHVTSLFLLHT